MSRHPETPEPPSGEAIAAGDVFDLLEPGGLLIATNVDPCNPTRCGMEFILDWHLIYRDPRQLLQLHPTHAPAGNVVTKSDDTGVNIYIEVRKPAAA